MTRFKSERAAQRGERKRLRPFWWERGSRCIWCGRRVHYDAHANAPTKATREHLRPTSKGGASGNLNIVVACRACNNARGSQTGWVTYLTGWEAMPERQRAHLGNMREWHRHTFDE